MNHGIKLIKHAHYAEVNKNNIFFITNYNKFYKVFIIFKLHHHNMVSDDDDVKFQFGGFFQFLPLDVILWENISILYFYLIFTKY